MTPTDNLRCITRVSEPKKNTLGWNVRVIRRGIRVTEFFSDRKYGGKAGSLSEAIHFRDKTVSELKPYSKLDLARRRTVRNTSGIPGVRRGEKKVKRGDKTFSYVVWTATGSPQPGKRRTKDFYVGKLTEDDAREAAIAQRLKWEKQMAEHEAKALPKKQSRCR